MMEEPGSFYICTETSPRCYIIQKVSARNVEKVCEELSGLEVEPEGWENGDPSHPRPPPLSQTAPPPLPVLPWWWSPETQRELDATPDPAEPSADAPVSLTPHQMRLRLKHQLEYYFSRENLAGDNYLRSQMDSSQWVPVHVIASFPMIRKLTLDLQLITAVLRTCHNVQVDAGGQKVRPALQRNTLILRDVPADTSAQEVQDLFQDPRCPNFSSVEFAHNNSWYVHFPSDDAAKKAFFHLRTVVQDFKGAPILVRIKTGQTARTEAGDAEAETGRGEMVSPSQPPSLLSTSPSQPPSSSPTPPPPTNFDLGYILAINGFLPQGTFRPLMLTVTPSTMQHLASTKGPGPGRSPTQPSPVSEDSSHSDPQPRFKGRGLGPGFGGRWQQKGGWAPASATTLPPQGNPPPDPYHPHSHARRGGRNGRWPSPPARRHTFHPHNGPPAGPNGIGPSGARRRANTGRPSGPAPSTSPSAPAVPAAPAPEPKFQMETQEFPRLADGEAAEDEEAPAESPPTPQWPAVRKKSPASTGAVPDATADKAPDVDKAQTALPLPSATSYAAMAKKLSCSSG